jgi:hypothetical protein
MAGDDSECCSGQLVARSGRGPHSHTRLSPTFHRHPEPVRRHQMSNRVEGSRFRILRGHRPPRPRHPERSEGPTRSGPRDRDVHRDTARHHGTREAGPPSPRHPGPMRSSPPARLALIARTRVIPSGVEGSRGRSPSPHVVQGQTPEGRATGGSLPLIRHARSAHALGAHVRPQCVLTVGSLYHPTVTPARSPQGCQAATVFWLAAFSREHPLDGQISGPNPDYVAT